MTHPCTPRADLTDDPRTLADHAARIRARVVRLSHQGDSPHLGSALSCIDILAAAYFGVLRLNPRNPTDPDRDRFILSKGHAVSALYATLGYRGFFDVSLLEKFNQAGTNLPEQPSPGCLPGVEAATGSLGHGLGIGAGMALAGRIARRDYRVYVLMSDGECNEGSVWESAMFAGRSPGSAPGSASGSVPESGGGQALTNLCTIVDFNGWQATDRSRGVLALEPLTDKFRAFGWSVVEVDGHDPRKLVEVMRGVPDSSGKPLAVIAKTVKGRGVSFMQDDNNWHYRIPTEAEVATAQKELGVVA